MTSGRQRASGKRGALRTPTEAGLPPTPLSVGPQGGA